MTITDEFIEEILVLIQNFDPPGCAYRDINESLNIQIENLEITSEEREELKANLNKLFDDKSKINNISENNLNNLKILSLIPAGGFGVTKQNYVRPDILAINDSNTWHVSLNDVICLRSY